MKHLLIALTLSITPAVHATELWKVHATCAAQAMMAGRDDLSEGHFNYAYDNSPRNVDINKELERLINIEIGRASVVADTLEVQLTETRVAKYAKGRYNSSKNGTSCRALRLLDVDS